MIIILGVGVSTLHMVATIDHDAAAALLAIDDIAPHRSFIATHSHRIQPSDHLFPVIFI